METEEKIRILREFHENAVAASEIYASNIEEYRGKIIAVCDGKVVASGLTDDELERNISPEYRSRPDLFVRSPIDLIVLMSAEAPVTAAYA